ncbi:hypothetical protein VIBNISOn1_1750007 [Vibrio nigripulchritudo SOn1]|uniref:Uncharacterized protein n=1 Tax=Vibrio nigripulchritudo SOn1 TaxID=1238450 RepID=A0AAV2VNW1_9VIBR|nr:hypothetical protein VIBNISOn1_1750007 [Vibrio nigripulchritudo SOn1]
MQQLDFIFGVPVFGAKFGVGLGDALRDVGVDRKVPVPGNVVQ